MRSLLAAVALSSVLCGCEPECERRACEEADVPQAAAEIDQGVVGVIGYQTDISNNGCIECSFMDAEFWVRTLDEPVRSQADALAVVAEGNASAFEFSAHGSYERALDSGDYLMCYRSTCAALHVEAGDVFTVNVQLRDGPPSLIVFAPKSDRQRDDLVFDTNKE